MARIRRLSMTIMSIMATTTGWGYNGYVHYHWSICVWMLLMLLLFLLLAKGGLSVLN